MKTMIGKSVVVFAIVTLLIPQVSFAQTTPYEISGWIPYWRAEKGVESILPHLSKFTEVNPFVYTVKQDGSLFLPEPLDTGSWATLRARAKEANVRFIPTVMWANPDAIHDTLSNPDKRAEHIRGIAKEVYGRGFEGIDIDYEGKYAKTRPYFSLFLKELNTAIGYDKWIMCTIEARTPLESRYSTLEAIPDDIEYANDFVEINKYCDKVRIMAYDQGRFDLKLNDANKDPYVPVADVAWVKKVMELTAKDIDKSKLAIGVATYGYEYDMFVKEVGGQVSAAHAATEYDDVRYSRLWSFNPMYALDQAKKLNATPVRNSAGEMMLVYPASQSIDPAIPLPDATRVMVWSDAEAIRQKAELAKTLGVTGIAIFKIDGGQDPALWDVLAAYKGNTPNQSAVRETPSSASGILTSSLPIPTKNLEYGMRTQDVIALQKLLNAHGYTIASSGGGSPGKETTFFGPATKNALIKFQKANKVTPASGYFGPKTRLAFQSL